VVAHTRRARLFLDSLSVISTSAIVYVVISFFQPLRMRLVNQEHQRRKAEELITQHPGDIDDFFKLWPHDKHYYFDRSRQAGLAYHVSRGVALVVGDPFGDPDRFPALLRGFNELCFVNDWLMSFVHTGGSHMELYEQAGLRLQKIGEEAVVNLARFAPQKNNKYFRQIRNRFSKLGYSVEILQPPHSPELLKRFRAISDEWLARPGRMERRLLLGFYEQGYMQQCPVAVLRDEKHQVQGFMNLVPTYLPHTANYDLLRCSNAAPGNSNDFLVLNVIELLEAQGVKTLNLGLCPLSGLDDKAEDASLIDTALRFVYSNGDRFYSFSGLRRFKAKYQPEWDGRYIAYRGGIRNFTRTIAALARAMKV
jgi:phosphatidylglycerol lysyltransferase